MWRSPEYLVIAWICCQIISTETKAITPSFLKTCGKSDPVLNDCVRESLETLLPALKNGIEELDVPAIDPLKLDELNLALGGGEVNLQMTMTEVIVRGLSQTEVVSVKTNVEDGKLEISTRTPTLDIMGSYIAEGGVRSLPLRGEGTFNVSMVDVTSAWMVYYQEVPLPDVSHVEGEISPMNKAPADNGTATTSDIGMEVETFALDVMPSKVSYYFDGFMDGENSLGKAANSFLNENAHEVFNDVKGQVLQELGRAFANVANALLFNFREDQLWNS